MRRCDAFSCIRRIRFLLRIRVKKPGQGFDLWPDPTWTQIADPTTRWPVIRRPGSIHFVNVGYILSVPSCFLSFLVLHDHRLPAFFSFVLSFLSLLLTQYTPVPFPVLEAESHAAYGVDVYHSGKKIEILAHFNAFVWRTCSFPVFAFLNKFSPHHIHYVRCTVARYCCCKSPVRPSVSLSVTLMYRDHLGGL